MRSLIVLSASLSLSLICPLSPKTLELPRKPKYPRRSTLRNRGLDKHSIIVSPLTTGALRLAMVLYFFFNFFFSAIKRRWPCHNNTGLRCASSLSCRQTQTWQASRAR